jgi:hypothetical protein
MPVMRIALQHIIAAVVLMLLSTYTQAFGPTGHRIVGTIAESWLCPAALRETERLLGDQSLAEAGLWPDWIRGDRQWRHTSPWHYVNVADDVPMEQASGGDRGDVLQAIERFRGELADPQISDEGRAQALRFLAHFVADVHQPLHVGLAEDRGGNSIAVRVDGRSSNLHRVWDAEALLREDRRRHEYGDEEQTEALRALTAPERAALQASSVLDWAAESRDFRSYVYNYPPPPAGAKAELDTAYLDGAGEITRLRLSRAGVRLAGLLNVLYCPADELP